jgi:hypothetical protein
MKKKIIGILVCMLLFGAMLPVATAVEHDGFPNSTVTNGDDIIIIIWGIVIVHRSGDEIIYTWWIHFRIIGQHIVGVLRGSGPEFPFPLSNEGIFWFNPPFIFGIIGVSPIIR